jgi:ferritin
MELTAYYTYLSMAAHFEAENLRGFSAWMFHHSQEEMMHAMKIYDYINDQRGRVKLLPLDAPPSTWATPLAAFEDALKHEQKVTASINKLIDLAIKEGDHATHSFLKWFVDEQVEEEAMVDQAIQDLKLIGDFGPGIFMMDRELAGQQGAAESQEGA